LARNRERTGVQDQNVDGPPAPLVQNNSGGFSFVVPTEFVELPSKGKYYPEGHPLHEQETIEIKQMTAKEEDILTSRSLLKKGVALERLIESIIVDKRIDPNSLLVGDRNAIIIATRVSGYGGEYDTQVTCPACATKQPYSFNLNDAEIYDGSDISKLDLEEHDNGTFTVQLPKTEVNVTFSLLTGDAENSLMGGAPTDKKRRSITERTVTGQIASMVVAVNGDTSIQAIKYLVENIPSMDSRHLRAAWRLVSPNIDLTQNFECSECDHVQEMEVPLTADFFWPNE